MRNAREITKSTVAALAIVSAAGVGIAVGTPASASVTPSPVTANREAFVSTQAELDRALADRTLSEIHILGSGQAFTVTASRTGRVVVHVAGRADLTIADGATATYGTDITATVLAGGKGHASGASKTAVRDRGTVYATGEAEVTAASGGVVFASGSATVRARDAFVSASGDACVHAAGDTFVTADDQVFVVAEHSVRVDTNNDPGSPRNGVRVRRQDVVDVG